MIVDSSATFRAALASGSYPPAGRPTARAAFLVEPLGFHLSEEAGVDHRYVDFARGAVEEHALLEHARLARALRDSVPTVVFPGDPETPSAVFANHVFASVPGRLIVGRMRHAVRRREAARPDVRRFCVEQMGCDLVDLSGREDLVAELTGALVIDRARNIGFCGLSERCDRAGAEAMDEAFGLALTFRFELERAEQHANAVLAVLAGRALAIYPPAFQDPDAALAIAELYDPCVLVLDDGEKAAFVGNCVALSESDLWLSAAALQALRPASRAALESWGFRLRAVALSEVERAGGSLRCCLVEIF